MRYSSSRRSRPSSPSSSRWVETSCSCLKTGGSARAMARVRACGSSAEVEHCVHRGPEAAELFLHAAQPGLQLTAMVADLPEGFFEDPQPVPPLVPFLDTEEDRVDVHHRGANGGARESTFRRT